MLLDAGADVNVVDDGKTPLMTAAEYCWRNGEVIEMLIAKGANVNAKNKEQQTPLSITAQNAGWGPCPMVGAMVRQGWEHAKGNTNRAMRALLAAHADPNPAFAVAVRQGWAEGVEMLLKAGAKKDGAMEMLVRAKIDGKIKAEDFEATRAALQ